MLRALCIFITHCKVSIRPYIITYYKQTYQVFKIICIILRLLIIELKIIASVNKYLSCALQYN